MEQVEKIDENYCLMVEKFAEAKKIAKLDSALEPLCDLVTPDGQLLTPVYALKPWHTSQKGDDPPHEIKPAQHLLDGGLLKFRGDLKQLESGDWLKQELAQVQKIMYSEKFRQLNANMFDKITVRLQCNTQGELVMGYSLKGKCGAHYAQKGIASSKPYVKSMGHRGVSPHKYVTSSLFFEFQEWVSNNAGKVEQPDLIVLK